ncbi:4-methyl-5(b-hydroxyethyl)-thiazole monophosphate biosynthesis [Desulfonispora thiosulfatigenes DSM 11270]|uniref:4-methyl-5(B-hydroxyethyl)-thiazole monophosphate biosynthesis n=1 Tax=Desulfonispora thiosulfatigenes DSM 11270 TaxID=656914 RepID=A0A1W1VDM6_DESTI|nr:DJ-1 family glyoxalase III [Desulfonispora thiosulfatigenes]SMB91310.1 4-methyl-5(b-hydroxyethyl)-thiazole monophosphate biosynthesis [Desulfonispora thiosulfatigenes DSM 11270]
MRVIVFLADGFEEVEAITVVDYLRRMNIDVDTVAITENEKVKGAHNVVVIADKKVSDLKEIDLYDGVVIPGGMPGAANLRNHEKVIKIVKDLNDKEKLVAAICAGPIVLQKAGVITSKRVTSYPGFENVLADGIYIGENVVRDKNIITSRGPALAVEFAIEIVDYLLGDEKARDLKEDILYKQASE